MQKCRMAYAELVEVDGLIRVRMIRVPTDVDRGIDSPIRTVETINEVWTL